MKKSGRKTCIIGKNVVPLHRDSKPHGEAFPRLHLQAEGEKTAGSPPQPMEAEKKTRNTPEKPYCRAPRRAGAEGRETGKTPLSTMLNYSIVMRSINSNLLNINQAKSRINAAKAALLKALGFTVGEAPDMKPFRPFFGHHAIPGGLLAGRKPQRG